MSEPKLTKDANALLKEMHREYKRRRKKGQSRQNAAIFGDSTDIQQEIMSDWSIEDINSVCYELHSADLLNCIFGDNDVLIAILTDSSIECAENRFVDAAKAIWNLLKEFIPFIPSGC